MNNYTWKLQTLNTLLENAFNYKPHVCIISESDSQSPGKFIYGQIDAIYQENDSQLPDN